MATGAPLQHCVPGQFYNFNYNSSTPYSLGDTVPLQWGAFEPSMPLNLTLFRLGGVFVEQAIQDALFSPESPLFTLVEVSPSCSIQTFNWTIPSSLDVSNPEFSWGLFNASVKMDTDDDGLAGSLTWSPSFYITDDDEPTTVTISLVATPTVTTDPRTANATASNTGTPTGILSASLSSATASATASTAASTPSPAPTSSSFSMGEKAGIGIGVGIVIAIALFFAINSALRYRIKRRGKLFNPRPMGVYQPELEHRDPHNTRSMAVYQPELEHRDPHTPERFNPNNMSVTDLRSPPASPEFTPVFPQPVFGPSPALESDEEVSPASTSAPFLRTPEIRQAVGGAWATVVRGRQGARSTHVSRVVEQQDAIEEVGLVELPGRDFDEVVARQRMQARMQAQQDVLAEEKEDEDA